MRVLCVLLEAQHAAGLALNYARDAQRRVQAAVCIAIIALPRDVKRLIHKLFLKCEEKLMTPAQVTQLGCPSSWG
jgi:hypothetical protein